MSIQPQEVTQISSVLHCLALDHTFPLSSPFHTFPSCTISWSSGFPVRPESRSDSLTQEQLTFPTTTVQPLHTPLPELPSLLLIGKNGPHPTQEHPTRNYSSPLCINRFPWCLDYSLQWPLMFSIASCTFPHLYFPSTTRGWSVPTASTSSPPILSPVHSSQVWSLPTLLHQTTIPSRWTSWKVSNIGITDYSVILKTFSSLDSNSLFLIGCCFPFTMARSPLSSSSAEL